MPIVLFKDGRVNSKKHLKTIADGTIMNNADSTATTNSVLTSGSVHNVRYEITNVKSKTGTFTVAIRAGNDNQKRKQNRLSFQRCLQRNALKT